MRPLLFPLLVLVLAAPASAHVTVIPAVARPGDTVALTFRVPNERQDAATTSLRLYLPSGVAAKDISGPPGWSHQDKANGEIAFVPDTPGDGIAPGRTEDFKVTVGPLPQADRVVFKALQTYADGQIVRWIEDNGPDDEQPAAILDLSGKGNAQAKGAWPLYVLAGVLLAVVAVGGVLLSRRARRARRAQ